MSYRRHAGPATISTQVCALDAALSALEQIDPRRARVIELRFFSGLTVEQTTVLRDWRLAPARLARELSARPHNDSR